MITGTGTGPTLPVPSGLIASGTRPRDCPSVSHRPTPCTRAYVARVARIAGTRRTTTSTAFSAPTAMRHRDDRDDRDWQAAVGGPGELDDQQQRRRDDRPDRQVEPAHDHDEQLPERNDREERCLAGDVAQVRRVVEVRLRGERRQGDEDGHGERRKPADAASASPPAPTTPLPTSSTSR